MDLKILAEKIIFYTFFIVLLIGVLLSSVYGYSPEISTTEDWQLNTEQTIYINFNGDNPKEVYLKIYNEDNPDLVWVSEQLKDVNDYGMFEKSIEVPNNILQGQYVIYVEWYEDNSYSNTIKVINVDGATNNSSIGVFQQSLNYLSELLNKIFDDMIELIN